MGEWKFIDKSALELAISLYQNYKGHDIGTDFRKIYCKENKVIKKISLFILSIQKTLRSANIFGFWVMKLLMRKKNNILQYLYA
ncbi:MAG: hypothetical protein HUJ74_01740 [Lachnospiraceae bacterium]|nr:hypothetical protein [Lachnospiraceae bacterium]